MLRHPRLSADAKTLLTWQLSLPAGARQSLSETAHRADIKKVAFQKAKRQLLEAQYLHEWRMRLESGRCGTVQLVSNEPLSAKEALAVRDGLRPAPAGARSQGPSGPREPTAAEPAAGQPTGRPACRQPQKDLGGTSRPTTPAAAPAEHRDDGERLLRTLAHGDPRLVMPAPTARRWASLAAAWLDSGMSRDRIRRVLTDGLGDARNPLGVLRWRLEHALPDAVPTPSRPAPKASEPPRLLGMRECRSDHIQPRLFVPRPGHDDGLCPDCRAGQPADQTPTALLGAGYAAFVAARKSARRTVPIRR